jgi:hypothetical protein
MTTRKLEQRDVRNIQKVKNTYLISIPIELIRKFGWREHQKVAVKEFGKNKILITDWKNKK